MTYSWAFASFTALFLHNSAVVYEDLKKAEKKNQWLDTRHCLNMCAQFYFVEWILNEVSSGQRLVIGKHDAIVLCVAFMTSLHRPVVGFLLLWRETSDVIGKHVKVGSVVNNPARQLFCTARAKHHAGRIEAAVVEQAREMRIGTLQRQTSIMINEIKSCCVLSSPSAACDPVWRTRARRWCFWCRHCRMWGTTLQLHQYVYRIPNSRARKGRNWSRSAHCLTKSDLSRILPCICSLLWKKRLVMIFLLCWLFCAILPDLGCENKANNHDRERSASPARL